VARPRLESSARGGIVVLALALAVGLLGIGWSVLESRRAIRAAVLEDNLTHARTVAALVGAEFKGNLDLTQAFTQRPSLRTAVAEERWEEADKHLTELKQINSDVGTAIILDASGKLTAREPDDPSVIGRDFSFREYFKGVMKTGKPFLSSVYVQTGSPQATVIAVAAPIVGSSQEIVGVLQTTIPVSRFDFLSTDILLPNEVSVRLFDPEGHVISSRGADAEKTYLTSPVVSEALRGESGVGEFEVPGTSGERLVAYAPIAQVRWAALVERHRALAYKPVADLTWRLASVAGVILIGALVATLVIVRLLRRLDVQRRESSAIVSSMADAVVVTDSEWRIVRVNRALERLDGRSARVVAGRKLEDVYRVLDEKGVPVPMKDLLASTKSAEPQTAGKFSLETAEGVRVPIDSTVSPIYDERERLSGYVLVTRDVSLQREIDVLKSTLVSTVSHELRTPLTMIQGFSELLLERAIDPKRTKEALREINVSTTRLSRLIDDLLSVSRMESGRIGLEIEKVDVAEVVAEVVGPFAAQHPGRFDVRVAPIEAMADRDKFVQILTNLVSNAVKYSPAEAPIEVFSRISGGSVQISVQDRGIGMSEEEVERAFEKFSRVERPEVKSVRGTGLGLYITKSLVEAHGGQIWLESEPGSGSTFHCTLPLADKAAHELEPATAGVAGSS
jgi:PAS domain S-box-containing protein